VQELGKFLQYLERGDVTEIVFKSGAAAAAKKQGKLKPVTREPLSAKHILKLVSNTPLEHLVPRGDGASPAVTTEINGVNYIATMARSGPVLMLRVRREGRHTTPPKVAIASIRTSAKSSVKPAKRIVAEEVVAAARRPEIARPKPVGQAAPHISYRPPAEASPVAPFVPGGVHVKGSADLCAMLTDARGQGASDVHVMSDERPRFRLGGFMVAQGEPLGDAQVRELALPLLDERSKLQFDELGYADFACEIEGAGRLRVNVNKQRTGVKACFRLIMDAPPTLESLGLPVELRKMLDYHQGLVVVSGPSGAGKTTTMAALVDMFNTAKAVHVITVEDPVEIIHPIKKAIVTQREVGAHTKSFHSALKGSLREDPDVIAIGELRDRETVEKALEAAETGHLVFATMSAPSGASTIGRLIDMFPPDDQSQVRATLAGALKFVVSQRLVARKDNTGLVAAAELLTGGMALWSLIRDDKLFQLPSLLQRGRGFGMIRLEDSLNALVEAGTVSIDTAKQHASDPRLIGPAELDRSLSKKKGR
jgi:twitching motility protein PilT